MTVQARSLFREFPASTTQTFVGALGGNASVPFLFTLNLNMNRDGSANMIQWADCVRGYGSNPPVLTVPAGVTPPTYDATKGVVSTGSNQCLSAVLSPAFSISAGSTGGITNQAIGTVWVVGEIDANPLFFQFLFALFNSGGNVGCSVQASNTNTNYSTQGRSGLFANSTVAATDGVCRLIVSTIFTGNYTQNEVPNGSGAVQVGNTTTAINEPYNLMLFGGGLSGTTVQHNGIGSIREIGALNRIHTASDLTLIKNRATALGATL